MLRSFLLVPFLAASLLFAADESVAAGPPPLDREAAEAFVAILDFVNPPQTTRGAAAREIRILEVAAAYPGLPPDLQRQIQQAPAVMARLKRYWPALAAFERQAVREDLRRSYAPTAWKSVLGETVAGLHMQRSGM